MLRYEWTMLWARIAIEDCVTNSLGLNRSSPCGRSSTPSALVPHGRGNSRGSCEAVRRGQPGAGLHLPGCPCGSERFLTRRERRVGRSLHPQKRGRKPKDRQKE